jgi:hypothetical protein
MGESSSDGPLQSPTASRLPPDASVDDVIERVARPTAGSGNWPTPPDDRAKKGHDLARLQNRWRRHGLRHVDGLSPNELALESGRSVFQEHLDDFLKVGPQFVEGIALLDPRSSRRRGAPGRRAAGVAFPARAAERSVTIQGALSRCSVRA